MEDIFLDSLKISKGFDRFNERGENERDFICLEVIWLFNSVYYVYI